MKLSQSWFICCLIIAVVIQPTQAKEVTQIHGGQELDGSARTVKEWLAQIEQQNHVTVIIGGSFPSCFLFVAPLFDYFFTHPESQTPSLLERRIIFLPVTDSVVSFGFRLHSPTKKLGGD